MLRMEESELTESEVIRRLYNDELDKQKFLCVWNLKLFPR